MCLLTVFAIFTQELKMNHCSTRSVSQGRSWSAATVFTVRPGPTATVSAHRPRATRVRKASPPWAPGPREPISAPVSNIKAHSHRAKAETKANFIARKRSLMQGNVFTPVCHSVYQGGVSSQHASQVTCLHTGRSEYRGVCIQGGGGQTSPGYRRYYGIRSTSRWYASYWNAFLLPTARGRQCFRRCLSVHNQPHGFSFTVRSVRILLECFLVSLSYEHTEQQSQASAAAARSPMQVYGDAPLDAPNRSQIHFGASPYTQ